MLISDRSIWSQKSLQPLQITRESLDIIIAHHNIGDELDEVVAAFGDKPRSSEAGIGVLSEQCKSSGIYGNKCIPPSSVNFKSLLDMSYLLRYAEQDSSGHPWRIRQTGVFHRYCIILNEQSNLWILMHPKPNSKFERAIEDLDTAFQWRQNLDFLLFSSYFSNWRWYLENLSAEFESIVRRLWEMASVCGEKA